MTKNEAWQRMCVVGRRARVGAVWVDADGLKRAPRRAPRHAHVTVHPSGVKVEWGTPQDGGYILLYPQKNRRGEDMDLEVRAVVDMALRDAEAVIRDRYGKDAVSDRLFVAQVAQIAAEVRVRSLREEGGLR